LSGKEKPMCRSNINYIVLAQKLSLQTPADPLLYAQMSQYSELNSYDPLLCTNTCQNMQQIKIMHGDNSLEWLKQNKSANILNFVSSFYYININTTAGVSPAVSFQKKFKSAKSFQEREA
jgi:hypothetical protein